MNNESITDSVNDVVKERLKKPLWGYITLSWCGFNWQNLAILFMSKSSVTTRIEQIISAEKFYWLYLVAPVTVGIFLSVISPYLNYGIAWTKRYLEAKEREGFKKSLIAEYEMQKETADKKVEAINAEKLAQSVQDTKLVMQEEIAKREKLNTALLKSEYEQLERSISILKMTVNELNADIELRKESVKELKNEWQKYADKTARIVTLLQNELSSEKFVPEEFLEKTKSIAAVSIISQLYQRSRVS